MTSFRRINVLSITFLSFVALSMNPAFADQKDGNDGHGKKKTKSTKSSTKSSKKKTTLDRVDPRKSDLSQDNSKDSSKDKISSEESKKTISSTEKVSRQNLNQAEAHEEARKDHQEAREDRHEAREDHQEAREDRHEAREDHQEHREDRQEAHEDLQEAREDRNEAREDQQEHREDHQEAERREEHREAHSEAQSHRTDVDVNIVVGGPVVVGPRVVYAPIRHRRIVYRPSVVVFDPGISYSVETALGSTSLDSPFEQFLERDPTLDDTNGIEVRECGVSHLRMYFSHSASIIDKVWVVYGNNEVDLIDFAGEQFQPAASSEFIPIAGAERCVKRVFIKGRGTTPDSRVELVGRYRMDLAPATYVVTPFVWNASVSIRF